MTRIIRIAPMVLLCGLCGAQSNSSSLATKGACSPVATGNNNTFNITCQGISGKLGSQLVDLLNRLAKNQFDAEAVIEKLDGCLQGVRELREQQASRHLTDQQRAALLAALSPFKGARVTITATEGDPEAYGYAQDFVSLFRKADFTLIVFVAGAQITGVNPMHLMGGPPPTGLVLLPKDVAEWRSPVFQSFDKALRAAGVQHSAEYIGNLRVRDTDLEFLVGLKARD